MSTILLDDSKWTPCRWHAPQTICFSTSKAILTAGDSSYHWSVSDDAQLDLMCNTAPLSGPGGGNSSKATAWVPINQVNELLYKHPAKYNSAATVIRSFSFLETADTSVSCTKHKE